MKLEGKVAIVTGGGRGIGQGIVHCLAEEGADVAVVDIIGDNARKVADEVKALGRKSLAIVADVTDSKQIARLVQETIDTFGKIDILVNNAGSGFSAKTGLRFVDITEEEWDEDYKLDLKTQILMSRAVAPHFMKQKSGKIINIGAEGGSNRMGRRVSAYMNMKAADIHFTKELAAELAEDNINVNCVCPGWVWTPRLERAEYSRKAKFDPDPEAKGMTPREYFLKLSISRRVPLKREQTPEDIGHAVVFLVSEDAKNITGQSLFVDGGLVMS